MDERTRATSLFTTAQVRQIDRHAITSLGIGGFGLMQRAAASAYVGLRRRWPDARRLLLLAGSGNNGGDGFLLGRYALRDGLKVEAIALSELSRGDAERARQAFLDAGGRVRMAQAGRGFAQADICVDALFGIGLDRAPEGEAAALIETLNASGMPTLALDLPSGLDADRGVRLGACVRADATISLIAWKRGLFTADGADAAGARELASLDVPDAAFDGIQADAELLDASISNVLRARAGNVNKGHFGHVLLAGGNDGMGGSVRLAGEGALRTGAGLVTVATRPAQVPAMNAARPELMAHGIVDDSQLRELMERASVLAVGPGLGQDNWARMMHAVACTSDRRLVLDADALNLLAQAPLRLTGDVVLTPHPGEAARLLGCSTGVVQNDRFRAVRELASRYGAVVILKGAGSLVADPSGRVAVCAWGNAGMASGGMGDVLTGIVAGLLAQGLSTWDAARFGVALHARAGDVAAADAPRGLLASDLFGPLRRLANRFES